MKTTLHLCLLICLLSTSSLVFGQGVSKTLVKSFNPAAAQSTQLLLDGPVVIKNWDNKIIRVQMSVELTNANEQTIKGLVQAGRYNLEGTTTDGQFVISAPGLQRAVEINGHPLEEIITYIVYLPNDMAGRQTGKTEPVASTEDF